METQLVSWLQSSQDPTQIANKVKGAILALSSFIIFFAAQVFHITLSADDMISLATEIGTIAGLVWGIYGCVLHLITWFGTVKTAQQVQATPGVSNGTSAMPPVVPPAPQG